MLDVLAPKATGHPLPENTPQPPAGPPYLIGFPLYDWCSEELHNLIDGFSVQLDKATGTNVLLQLVANPNELCSVYETMRSLALAKGDAAGAKAYLERLKRGTTGHDRGVEVVKLAELLKIQPSQLPCIAFLSFPPSLPAGILSVKREWISTREKQIRFAKELERFFGSFNIQYLLKDAPTNVELIKVFEKQINGWFTERLTGTEINSESGAFERRTSNPLNDNAWYTYGVLAEGFGVPKEALRKRLDRYRKQNMNGWKESEDRRPREVKYLYLLKKVRHIIDDLHSSSDRPAK